MHFFQILSVIQHHASLIQVLHHLTQKYWCTSWKRNHIIMAAYTVSPCWKNGGKTCEFFSKGRQLFLKWKLSNDKWYWQLSLPMLSSLWHILPSLRLFKFAYGTYIHFTYTEVWYFVPQLIQRCGYIPTVKSFIFPGVRLIFQAAYIPKITVYPCLAKG